MRADGLALERGHEGGEQRFRIVATSLFEHGWNAVEIKQEIAARYWHFAVPPDWDDNRLQQEIERCGAAGVPLETKPAAKAEQISDDGLPGWLRDRIESVAIPADRDLYFRDVVAALAGRGWDSSSIATAIAGRGWIPERYAGRHLEWGIRLASRALSESPLRSIDEAAPDDVAASDLRAVQRAIASGRWRENSQAKEWAGHSVAAAMKLDVETHKAKIVALLKTWIENGALVVVEGKDERRKKRSFVEVGSVAE